MSDQDTTNINLTTFNDDAKAELDKLQYEQGVQTVCAKKAWRDKSKAVLKAEIVRRGYSYNELSTLLKQIGVNETAQNISNKINRGAFGADFMLQVLFVIGCKELRL